MLDLQTTKRAEAERPAAGVQPAGVQHIAARGHLVATDGVLLHYRSWLPADHPPVTTLVYVHGIASHSAWFAETAAFLADRGVAVYAPDRRGSGLSGGPRGHIPSYEQAVTDVHGGLDLAARRHGESPIFLAGSSWAARLAVVAAAQAQARLAGLLLLGPGLFPRVDLSVMQKVAVLAAHRLRPEQALWIPLTPADYTRQPTYRSYIANDPYRLLTASARFFWETRRLDRARDRYARALPLPLLVQLGGADRIMNAAATCTWANHLPTTDRTVVVYRDAMHTLDFEDEPIVQQYRADLLGWLHRQLARRAATNEEAIDIRLSK